VSDATRIVGRNTAVQILGRAAAAGLGLALAAVLTRALSLDGYGSLSTALAVLGILAVVHDAGAVPIAVRRVARDADEAGPLLGSLLTARLAAAAPLALVGVAVLLAAGERGPFLLWALAAFALVLVARAAEIVDVALRVAQRLGRSVVANLAGRSGNLALVLLLAAAGAHAPGPFLLAAAGGVVLSAGLRVALARPWHRLRPRRDVPRLRVFLREALPAGAASILMVAYLQVDAPIVRGIAGAREAALLNAPYRFFVLGASLPGMVMVSASPILAKRFPSDRPGFRRAVRRLLIAGTAVALPLAAGVALAAPALLRVVFGPAYEVAAPTLVWLSFAAAAAVPGTVATAALIAADRAGVTAGLAALALVANVGLDLVLVPVHGGEGAAVATLVAEGFVALGGVLLLARAGRDPS
jgi:O-antigen/teichoic acid export membrane protein